MYHEYTGVTSRFLRDEERFCLSEEKEMPLVLEAHADSSAEFLQIFLNTNAIKLVEDLAKYGAILLRGFEINTDDQFEKSILSIPEFRGIDNAFMSENGRTHVGTLKYILHTNSVYKTGGTLYLGGFHTENYYSADVPSYICFYCSKASVLGGETGIINTEKIYRDLDNTLKQKLEKNTYFVSKWLVSDVADRYKISSEKVEQLCAYFNLPLVGEGAERFVLMYKPSVFEHPLTKEKSLQLNLFELPSLNKKLRQCFMNDYRGTTWFWHRFFWKLPTPVFNSLEFLAVIFIAFFKSPKNAYKIMQTKFHEFKANRKNKLSSYDTVKVGACFSDKEITELAKSMRNYYSSCLWEEGDILLIDNKKVMHAGMPGMGPRTIRAMICNPIEMNYSFRESGCCDSEDRKGPTVAECMSSGTVPGAHKK